MNFRALLSTRTLRETAYAVAAFGFGLAWFTVLVTLLSLSAGLLVTLLGLPLLLATLLLVGYGAKLERWWIQYVLGERIQTPLHRTGTGWRGWLVTLIDPVRWREVLYLLLLFPTGLTMFIVVVTGYVSGLTLLTAPAWFWATSGDFLWPGNDLDTAWEVVGSVVAGALLLVLTPLVVHVLARLQLWLARVFLGPTHADLARQRDRAVDAAESDRRRIERDLHDGAQARLVALAVDLGRARERLESGADVAEATELVARAHDDAKQALAEVRDLARGIHPAILVDRGLDAAVSSLAARSPVPIAVTSRVEQRPSRPVESAAYFVVAEALANVARHSGATTAAVSLIRNNGELVVDVQDNGTGGASAHPGSGLAGLRERVEALGGTFRVRSPQGGPTTITAVLPCA